MSAPCRLAMVPMAVPGEQKEQSRFSRDRSPLWYVARLWFANLVLVDQDPYHQPVVAVGGTSKYTLSRSPTFRLNCAPKSKEKNV